MVNINGEKEIFRLQRNLILFCYIMAIMEEANSSFIVVEDLYTRTDTPPFTLSVHYTNDMDSAITLTCKTSNSGIVAPPTELPVGTKQKTTVEFTGTLNTGSTTLPLEVSCSIGDKPQAYTKAIISNTALELLELCHSDQIQPNPSDGKYNISIRGTSGTKNTITINPSQCSCEDDDGNSVLQNFKKIVGTDFDLTADIADSSCDASVCSCTLECPYSSTVSSDDNLSVSRKVKVLKPAIYIASSFEKLTLYKNTSTVTAFAYPPSDVEISCFVNKVNISDDFTAEDVIEYNDVGEDKDLALEKWSLGVYHVFPKNSSVKSGLYGIKCEAGTASDTFLFQFINSEASSIAGEKINFDQYVSVPCSCDGTPSFCDGRCCCDPDCSDVQVFIHSYRLHQQLNYKFYGLLLYCMFKYVKSGTPVL